MKVKGKQLEDTLRTSSSPFTKIYSSEFIGSLKSESNDNIELEPSGTGKVTIKGNATTGSGQIVLNCEQNSHGIIIKGPPHSASASYTLVLPNDDGSVDQVLKTDGSGNLSWVDQSSGGGGGGFTYSRVTSNVTTAVVSTHYSVDVGSTTGANVTITLPALSGVTKGQEIRVKVYDQASTYKVIIAPASGSGDKIDSSTSNFELTVKNQAITLVASDSSAGHDSWEII